MADLFPALSIAGNLAPTTKPELAEFDQRMMPLLAAFPLYELQNKHSLRDYHGLELGICLLLFVLEKMLHYEPCTYEDAQGFVRFLFPALTKQQLTYTEAASLTQKLLDELSNQGRPFVYPYRSPVDGMDHEVKFRLLEQHPLPEQDTIGLRLTAQGLDLLFKSREIYRDLQFSVMQLYLDQQIRRGTFEEAIQTVNELGLAVTSMEQQVDALREEIRRNVVEALQGSDYHRLLRHMSEQLEREGETFNNLIALVRETRANLAAKQGALERLQAVDRLDRRLQEVAQQHLRLFTRQLTLNVLVSDALAASLRSTLTVRFHLEKELQAEVLRQRPPGWVLTRTAVLPLLRPFCPRVFSLSFCVGPQTLLRREYERPAEDLMEELDEEYLRTLEEAEEKQQQRTLTVLKRCFHLLLEPLIQATTVSMSQIVTQQDWSFWQQEEVAALAHLLLLLHQAEEIAAFLPWDYTPAGNDPAEYALYQVLTENEALARLGVVKVGARDEAVTLPFEIKVSDFILTRGDYHAV